MRTAKIGHDLRLSVGWLDQPKLFSHSQIEGKLGQGLGMAEVQQLSSRDSMQN